MQRLKILGLVLMAMFAFGVVASASASAEELPNLLPLGSESSPVSFSATSGAGKFEIKGGFGSVKCNKDTGSGRATSGKLGTFDVLFEECKDSLSRTCTGLTDTTAGSVLVLGAFHVRYIVKPPNPKVAIIFLLKEVHFECTGFGSLLIRVKGCAAGEITPINSLTKSLTVSLTQSGGANGITEVFNESNSAKEKCILESSEGAGGFIQSGEETTETINTFKQGGSSVEALVMA